MLQQMLDPVQYQVSGFGPGGSSSDGQAERGLKAGGDSPKSMRCDKFGSRKREGLSIVDMYSDMPTSHKKCTQMGKHKIKKSTIGYHSHILICPSKGGADSYY